MADASINIVVAGEAGQGLVTIGQLMTRALIRSGYEVVVTQDYMSRIRGGHNLFIIRTGPEPIHGPREGVDILVALDALSVQLHRDELTERGVVVADEAIDTTGLKALKVPFKSFSAKSMYWNTAALGVLGSAICHDIGVLESLLTEAFEKKGAEVLATNLGVLRAAYAWVKDQPFLFECLAPPNPEATGRLMLHGNEAIALGALAAGVDFCSFYPMTPGTTVALTLADQGQRAGVVVEQAEDEIAAANMAIGAAYAGARAIVPTAGGGFALMVEAVSLAGMLETPVVFVLAQRPGPATGLPTRTMQGDLNLALYAGHGEFPRAIFAPGTVEECFSLTYRAFDMAEKYQTPCFVLTDQYQSDSYRSVAPFDLDELPEIAKAPTQAGPDYKRYALTPDGVSPRVIPGFSQALVKVDSDEHDEAGHITESPAVRMAMCAKRQSKGLALLQETIPPELYGERDTDLLLVCWGSTLGAALEAAHILRHSGKSAAVLHFCQVWPLLEDQFLPILEAAGRVVAVEGNESGQMARLIRQETGFDIQDLILRFDGWPFTVDYILKGLDGLL